MYAFTTILSTVIPAQAGTHAGRPMRQPRQSAFSMVPDFRRGDGFGCGGFCNRLRLLALSLLFIFLANLATWSGGGAQMAHELGHGAVAALSAGQHATAQPAVVRAFVEADDDSAPATTEHQALHAVDHMQFFPPTPAHLAFARLPDGLAAGFFLTRHLPPARSDLPFRPPRLRT